MSVRVMAQVWELDLPQPLKFLCLALADWADDEGGNIYPSVGTIARKVGASERTVQRQLADLVELGLVEVCSHAGGGRGRTKRLRLHTEKGDKLTPMPKRVTAGAKRVTPGAEKGDTAMSPDPSVIHQIEPISNFQIEHPIRPGESRRDYVKRLLATAVESQPHEPDPRPGGNV